uniref:DNA primase n=2 Tax=Ditylum brightwellii TaxID=49249 RepID=A0A7S4QK67_9STRA|mmetsp:Transcript_41359/g.62747  ORF Transcript_41359/g.62747 Transcript_41359/m.62747 type:complete len:503 (+) Transcript_41359:155-1663(+)
MVAQQQTEDKVTPGSSRKRDRTVIRDDDDNDNEEEFEMETTTTEKTKKEEIKPSEKSKEVLFSPELLSMYYSRLFPYHLLHSWLSYNPSNLNKSITNPLFSHREFSFTIERVPGEEIYLRYQSFPSEIELSNAIRKRRPVKIDIGAIFSHPPKDSKTIASSSFTPSQRELVFDVDLTDYDPVRGCGCQGATICRTCWTYMTMAVKVMDVGLKEDFGFKHVAWFYSGRRGVHAWVCDGMARGLTDEGRSAVATYFEIPMASDKNKSAGLAHPLHPMLRRSYGILEPMFIQHVLPAAGHGLLATEEQWTKLLSTLPPAASSVADWLLKKWNGDDCDSTPEEKWIELKRRLLQFRQNESESKHRNKKKLSSSDSIRIEQWPIETVFKYSYPRLDINVSKMRNHLLKSPFCVHPKTGRVCIPINVSQVEQFDPFDVPTLPMLMKELDEYDGEEEEGRKKVQHAWQKTSLRESFEHFEKAFLGPMWKELRKEKREEAEERAAYAGDF